MRKQALFDLVPAGTAGSVADEEIADDALALLVNKKGIPKDAAAFDGSVPGENLGIHVAQNHLGRGAVVPGEEPPPHGDLIFQQRTKVSGREVSEIEDFHDEPRFQSFKVARFREPDARVCCRITLKL